MPRKAKQTTSSSREGRRLLEDYDQAESGEHRNHYTVDDDLLIPDTDERKLAVHRRRGIYRWLAVVISAAGLVLFMSNWHRSCEFRHLASLTFSISCSTKTPGAHEVSGTASGTPIAPVRAILTTT